MQRPKSLQIFLDRWQILLFLLVGGIVVTEYMPWIPPILIGSLLGFRFLSSEDTDAPPDARCGAMCSLCSSYQKGHCPSCAFGDEKLRISCPIFLCAKEKETVCTECPDIVHCQIYRKYARKCPFATEEVLEDTLPESHGFLVTENTLESTLELFTDRIVRGDLGLIILRQSPDILREWPLLEKVPVVQLRQTVTQDNCLDPTNLAKLHLTIEEFFKAAPRSVVLLEGMEYLIFHNEVNRMLKFIHSVVGCVKKYASRFIIIIDPRILEREELALMERELVHLRSE
jgi:hypothetical protein